MTSKKNRIEDRVASKIKLAFHKLELIKLKHEIDKMLTIIAEYKNGEELNDFMQTLYLAEILSSEITEEFLNEKNPASTEKSEPGFLNKKKITKKL